MQELETIDAVLDFAIGEEEAAAKFYTNLAAECDPSIGKVFEGFAKEELGHKEKLLQVKAGKQFKTVKRKVADLKLADYLPDVKTTGKLSYQDALVVAMKKEKAAYRLYTILAEIAMDENLRSLMLALAQEEAKHKLRFEIEYDDKFFPEN